MVKRPAATVKRWNNKVTLDAGNDRDHAAV
jgi:hypothetical protein